ncbi:MAG: Rne/Rng family ribonuclease [Rhodospirillales bacterium]|nr:Rne/Rng family ribonuclease [Rhodospirillales bacterium]
MAAERIYINGAPGETRIAILEDGRLSDLIISRVGRESLVGNIYLGRVTAVLDGLQAAFVEIGEERAGFLSVADLRPQGDQQSDDRIANYIAEGDSILVQVLRDPEEDKGAKLTGRVSLTGRDMIFAPGQSGITLSRKITGDDERQRLNDIMAKIVPEGTDGAFVLRTVAAEAEFEDLEDGVKRILERWREIQQRQEKASPPQCLDYELSPAFAVLRDYGGTDLESLVCDDPELLAKLKAFAEAEMPDLEEAITGPEEKGPLFAAVGVEEMIDAALDPVVELPSGGSIIISETPALTAIDVNTGSATGGGREQTALMTNEEAAVEIAHQIRLRNLSGLLVIDFVSMRRRENQEAVYRRVRRAVGDDPLRPHVVGFTKLGLLEMTRRRKGPSLSEIVSGRIAVALKSPETVGLEALRGVIGEAQATAAASYTIEAAPDVVAALKGGLADVVKATEKQHGYAIKLKAVAHFGDEAFQIIAAKAKK